MSVYIFEHMHIYTYMYMHRYICMFMYLYEYISIFTCMCVCICVRVYMYMCNYDTKGRVVDMGGGRLNVGSDKRSCGHALASRTGPFGAKTNMAGK